MIIKIVEAEYRLGIVRHLQHLTLAKKEKDLNNLIFSTNKDNPLLSKTDLACHFAPYEFLKAM